MELQKDMEAKSNERKEASAKIVELVEKIQVSKEEQGTLFKELDALKEEENKQEFQLS